MQTTAPEQIAADAWQDLDDDALLRHRICDLRLRLPGSAVEPQVRTFHHELAERGLVFHPSCYLTTEWLCPDGVPLIGIPFCLAHPRLVRLEKTMMLEVEGGTPANCMKLLRHEAGHAFNYAYRLYRRTRWRELFGRISEEYDPGTYYPRKYSRQFVEHLPDNYAQAHPDEDFAETFAVWLTPGLDWRTKYAGRHALKKLEYVDHLMKEVGQRPPLVSGGKRLWPVNRIRSTLASYYRKKRNAFGQSYPGYYDEFLKTLFATGSSGEAASRWLSRHRKRIVQQLAAEARLRKYAIDVVVRRLVARARELDLCLRYDESETLLRLCIALTAMLCEERAYERSANGKAY